MGVLIGFLVGWAMGAKGGQKGYNDVIAAGKEVLRSEEASTLQAVVRMHTEHTLRQLADWMQETREAGTATDDVMARVRRLVQPEYDDD